MVCDSTAASLRLGEARRGEMRAGLVELLLGAVELGAVRVELGRGGEGVERLPRVGDGRLGVALRVRLLVLPEPVARAAEQEQQDDQPDLLEAVDGDQVPVDLGRGRFVSFSWPSGRRVEV